MIREAKWFMVLMSLLLALSHIGLAVLTDEALWWREVFGISALIWLAIGVLYARRRPDARGD